MDENYWQSQDANSEGASYWQASQAPQPFTDPNTGACDAGASSQSPYQQNPYQQPFNQQGAQGAGQQQYYTQQPWTGQAWEQQTTYTAPYVHSKDHVAAGLLAIFLGSLGVHKFYLGYNTAGFIMLGVTILGSLLTIGIAGAVMGVIALVEGIIYLTRPQAVFDAEYVYGNKEWF